VPTGGDLSRPDSQALDVVRYPPKLANNPYAVLDSGGGHRAFLVQLHDHPGTSIGRLRKFTEKGYDVASLMDYSGVLDRPGVWPSLRWPPADHIRVDSLRTLGDLALIPSAEHVAYQHIVVPFVSRWIGRSETGATIADSLSCSSSRDCLGKFNKQGALPIIAHPWTDDIAGIRALLPFYGIEMYSAFAAARVETGDSFFVSQDRVAQLERVWDSVLVVDSRVVGVAVSDHFGAYNESTAISRRILDSGRSVILSTSASLEDLKDAMAARRVYAVVDFRQDKRPRLDVPRLTVRTDTLLVPGSWTVTWRTGSGVLYQGNRLVLREFEPSRFRGRYVRFVASLGDSVRVYSQALGISWSSP
jgi:hypothetical protein